MENLEERELAKIWEKPVVAGIAKAEPGVLKEEQGSQCSWNLENFEETGRRCDYGGDGEPDNLKILSFPALLPGHTGVFGRK